MEIGAVAAHWDAGQAWSLDATCAADQWFVGLVAILDVIAALPASPPAPGRELSAPVTGVLRRQIAPSTWNDRGTGRRGPPPRYDSGPSREVGLLVRDEEVRMSGRSLAVLFGVTIGAACSSPANPSNSGGGGPGQNCFVVVGNRGSITGTISGLAPFNGTIANGGANLVTGGPVATFTIGATNVQDGTGVTISGIAVVGTSSVGPGTAGTNAVSNMISVQTRSCMAGTGLWVASIAAGSGTITITSSTATGIAGSFSGTLEASAGSGAAGAKTISGTFSATY
jgi:hypothetical protein